MRYVSSKFRISDLWKLSLFSFSYVPFSLLVIRSRYFVFCVVFLVFCPILMLLRRCIGVFLLF
jgi:hypothetical protein